MKNPDRFRAARPSSLEGRLMAAGSAEMPSPDALDRAAQRLRIGAAVFASASAATALAPSVAAATAGAAATAPVAAATGVTGALILKSALIGVGIGVAVVATGSVLVRSKAPAKAVVAAAQTAPKRIPLTLEPTGRDALSILRLSENEAPNGSSKLGALRPSGAAAGLSSTEPSSVSPGGANPVAMSSVARFDDMRDLERPPPASTAQKPPTPSLSSGSSVSMPTGKIPAAVDSRLAQEIVSLDRARALLHQGSANEALRELDAFERGYGYVALEVESILVRIDVLLALGRRPLAVGYARALLRAGVPASQRKRLEELASGHE